MTIYQETMALGGFHPAPVGTPEMVADVFEQWVDKADVDGFNIAYVTSPGTFEDVVDLLVPELQRRGLYHQDYAYVGGTLRENLYGIEGQKHLRDDHYGHKFKFGSGFEGDTIEAFKAAQATKISTAKRRRSNGPDVPIKNGHVKTSEQAVAA